MIENYESLIDSLSERVRGTLSKKRAEHVFFVRDEVRNMCLALGESGLCQELSVAALIHDITKEITFEEQLILSKKYDIILNQSDLLASEVIHGKTAAALAKNLFSLPESVFLPVYYHTTGRAGMTKGEKILFLADYIEESRAYPDCRRLHDSFYSRVAAAADDIQRGEALDLCVYECLNSTIIHLSEKNKFIHEETLTARNSYLPRVGGIKK